MPKPLNQYLRVPFRGTHYVEAEALDSAIAQISVLENKLGLHENDKGGALEAPEESVLSSEQDAAEEAAFNELLALCGTPDDASPTKLLAFVKGIIAEKDKAVSDLNVEQGLHSTTKEQLASSEKDLVELAAWLNGESPSPYHLNIKELADELRQKVIGTYNAAQSATLAPETPAGTQAGVATGHDQLQSEPTAASDPQEPLPGTTAP